MLRSSRYCCLDSGLLYVFVKDSHRIINDFFTGLPLLLHLTDKVIIFIRMQVMEAQIFQLPFDIVNTKTVSQRSIYFYRFSCYTLLLVLAEYAERTHIVKSVSQFYNDNSDILSHRQEHFPEVFQLLMGCRESDWPAILKGTSGAKIAAWWDRAVDIIPISGGKGAGIQKVLAYYSLTPEDAMAFGDGNNDIEMFQAVGHSVAMGNASADLKAIASEVCGTCAEDGIYHYCKENGLI